MGRHRREPTTDLRQAIDCLPVGTREAMLRGVKANDIIVGAYVDRRGGVCPMLAAHRNGGRTDLLAFARAWDRFTGVRRRARRATERELRFLIANLEASLAAEDSAPALGRAISDHRELVSRRTVPATSWTPRHSRIRPGDPDRSKELGGRPGWAWLRSFRRYDEYERALERVAAAKAEADRASKEIAERLEREAAGVGRD